MKINKNENIECFDVDGTLVIHQDPNTIPEHEQVIVYDVVTNGSIILRRNEPMIRLLMEAKVRGFHVRVWSKSGYRWAADVIEALELEGYVDEVESKFSHYFDDLPIQDWAGERVFIDPDTIYKQTAIKAVDDDL